MTNMNPSPPDQTTAPAVNQPERPPLRSVHTTSFPLLLDQLRASVAVTTYQAGRLVFLRTDQGVLNTHFRVFDQPMGLATRDNRLAIGTAQTIWEFINVSAVSRRLEPPGKADACYMPLHTHITGNIHIHEMAFANDELWFVNTTFSCLCTRSPDASFAPRWRPPFISALTPEDRCHVNGLCLVNGQPRYVTAHGEADTPAGWREHKKAGGILIDVPANRVVTRNLSMPHSPRWHQGRLWVLNSGIGGIGTIDLDSGRYQPLAELPGFTRGLDFVDNLAFVGLSQVRESAVFSGIPLVDRFPERNCGVWVLDIRTGKTVAFVKFEDALQEIFAVQVLPGIRFPDLINDQLDLIGSTYVLPDAAMTDVPETLHPTAPG
ncbi:MAG: TIGR03032 family protein [Gemmataceae bacterium]